MCRTELTRQRGILADLVQHQLRPAMKAEEIPILDHKDLSASQKDELNNYFNDSVQPILSPLAVDIGHPFPFISSLALNLAITIHRPDLNQPLFIRLKVPTNRPRWVPVSEGGFVPLEQIMEARLKQLFPRSIRIECHFFRVIRGALELEDPDSLFAEIRKADLLLHHPYHYYETSILRFLESAVLDPKVLALKLTIYRTSSRSPIIQTLKEAAMAGKQVLVLSAVFMNTGGSSASKMREIPFFSSGPQTG